MFNIKRFKIITKYFEKLSRYTTRAWAFASVHIS